MKALQRDSDGASTGFTVTAKLVTSASEHFSAFNTDSAKAEDSAVSNTSDGCFETFDRRNPIDNNLLETSGTVLVFARVDECTQGHTVILSLVI